MENASKALIIAGAILLSILIISLGIMVYNNAKTTITNQNLDKEEVQVFNSEWETYVGDKRTANEVRVMIQAVKSHNGAETKADTLRFIDVKKSTSGADAISSAAANSTTPITNPNDNIDVPSLKNSTTYTIRTSYDSATGLVAAIYYGEN